MTLKHKIWAGYGVAFALMGLVVAWAVVNLVSLGTATDAILRENYRSILAAENMLDALERQDSGVLLMFLGDDRKGVAQYREYEAVFLEWLGRAKDNITIQGEAALLQSIETGYSKYRQWFSAMTDLPGVESPLRAASLGMYWETVYPLFAKIREECTGLRRLNEKTMYAVSVKAQAIAGRAIWSTAMVAAAALMVAVLFSLFIAERIVRPIRRFMDASRQISAGDYGVQVPVESGDELGRLAGEFNRMAAQLGRYHEMNIEQIIAEKNKGEAILSSIEDALVVFDTRLKMVGINPAGRRLLDLPFSEHAGVSCADILPVPWVCELIAETIEKQVNPKLSDERRIITLMDGAQSRHFLFSVTVIRGKERTLTGIVLLLRDVTRLKEIEQLKSDFVMAASHELRTPLTSLGMSIELLTETIEPRLEEKDRVLLRAAREEVQRMNALVNDLLDLSKIEAGRIEMDFERVPVQPLFAHVAAVFKNQMEIKAVGFSFAPEEDLPDIRADANKITWVLTNLVSNALRYVNRGGHIQLAAHRIGLNVHLSVQDDGPGIAPEYQSMIFQKFVKIKGREAGGSGLGLAICKEIVRAHGGAIWVESTVGHGSTFTFTVPVA
ncbi:MAG: ATP-binding protein [Desulfobacterales bacterium]|nr:ATP-binding protein [Desulfobacterales bacterium]